MLKRKMIGLVAGGSGGHLFPAIAVAEECQRKGLPIALLTDTRGERFIKPSSFQHITVVSNKGSVAHQGLRLLICSMQWIKKVKSVIGFGGQFTFLPLLIARLKGRRCAIHQSDIMLGKANRWLAPWMNEVFVSYEPTLMSLAKAVVSHTPVRQIFYDVPPLDLPTSFHETNPLQLAIVGGSQGAHFWSSLVPQALSVLDPKVRQCFVLVHQCPPQDHEELAKAYAKIHMPAKIFSFIEDMAGLLSQSHLILTRAGASTLAELMAAGRPALFVPYPYATQDHQWANAQYAVQKGGGWVYRQKDLTPERLASFLLECLHNPSQLLYAGGRMKEMTSSHAAQRLVKFCLTA